MTDTFDPGPGWRQVTVEDILDAPKREYLKRVSPDGGERYWARVPPVPPLPTAPYTVIRVTWKDDDEATPKVLVLDGSKSRPQWGWSTSDGADPCGDEDWVRRHVTGFEVLSEPRAVTAKAVIDRIRSLYGTHSIDYSLTYAANEFGVDQ